MLFENVISQYILDCHGGVVDVVLLIDTTNYTPATWNSTMTGIRWILEELNAVFGIVPTGTHVGLATYSTEGHLVLGLDYGTDITKIKPVLNTIAPGDTDVHNLMAGLDVAGTELLNKGRDYKVVIAVINSKVTNEADTASRAQYLSSQGINIIAVSLLPENPMYNLRDVVTYPGNVYYESYESLYGMWNNTDVATKMCPPGKNPTGTSLYWFIFWFRLRSIERLREMFIQFILLTCNLIRIMIITTSYMNL